MNKAYQSDITRFLQHYKQQHHDVEQRQRAGRARLWDVRLDAEQQEGFRAARVAQKPYVYQSC